MGKLVQGSPLDRPPGYPAPSPGRVLNLKDGVGPSYRVVKLKSLNGERKRGLVVTKTRRESGHKKARDDSIPCTGSKAAQASPWRQKVGSWSEGLGDERWRLSAQGAGLPWGDGKVVDVLSVAESYKGASLVAQW